MKICGIIPARYASSRFPGKPLADIAGKPMVQRVYEQAVKAISLSHVAVATDDKRIADVVKSFGGEVILTGSHHPSGTDRIIEAMGHLYGYGAFVNIQGDEPFIDPAQINLVCTLLTQHAGAFVATLVQETGDEKDIHNPNVVKVVTDVHGRALYFSRSPVPYLRNEADIPRWQQAKKYRRHVGIYGYTRDALNLIATFQPSSLEMAESLEQLRWLENGIPIHTAITHLHTLAVDTPADLEAAVAFARQGKPS